MMFSIGNEVMYKGKKSKILLVFPNYFKDHSDAYIIEVTWNGIKANKLVSGEDIKEPVQMSLF